MFNRKSKRIKQLEEELQKCKQSLIEDPIKQEEFEGVLKTLQSEDAANNVNKSTLILKVGDSRTGWIPNIDHRISLAKQCVALNLHKKYNIIIFNHAIDSIVVAR